MFDATQLSATKLFFSPLNKNFISNTILLNSRDRKFKMCSSSARQSVLGDFALYIMKLAGVC